MNPPTPENGVINIHINLLNTASRQAMYELVVVDNGIGIPEDKIEFVTEPFYQAKNDLNEIPGSGIGLALVKELVSLWNGSIDISSTTKGRSKGTQIVVALPLGGQRFVDEFAQKNEDIDVTYHREYGDSLKDKKSTILIVEDNADILQFLADELEPLFIINTAINGQKALDHIKLHLPDLILTDVMMPEMDGIEFCRSIRENLHTCHIPVIMLTARTADEHQVEGIETGADVYLSKPAKAPILIAQIKNLLRSRQQLKDVFSNQVVIEPSAVTVVPLDRQLLEKAITVVEDKMALEVFDVEVFTKEMSMSRASLYRKLKSITGLSPAEFIRSIRLKRAAQLLEESDLSIGQIISIIGVNEPSNFSKTFKKEFGMSPIHYRNEKLGNRD